MILNDFFILRRFIFGNDIFLMFLLKTVFALSIKQRKFSGWFHILIVSEFRIIWEVLGWIRSGLYFIHIMVSIVLNFHLSQIILQGHSVCLVNFDWSVNSRALCHYWSRCWALRIRNYTYRSSRCGLNLRIHKPI